MTYNIQNDFGLEDPGFALLREVAQRYCPEELQQERKAVLPDEVLNLADRVTDPTPCPSPTREGSACGVGSDAAIPLKPWKPEFAATPLKPWKPECAATPRPSRGGVRGGVCNPQKRRLRHRHP